MWGPGAPGSGLTLRQVLGRVAVHLLVAVVAKVGYVLDVAEVKLFGTFAIN